MNNPTPCPHCGNPLTIEQTDHFITEACESCLKHWQITHYENCCRNPNYQVVLYLTNGGTSQVRKQCKTCGAMPGSAIGGYSKDQREKLPVADLAQRDGFYQQSSDLRTTFYNRKQQLFEQQQQADRQAWWQGYTAYLNSPEWQRKRTKVLQRDNYLCQACLIRPANEVHHRSYEFVDFTGKEPCFDLISICSECHHRLHEIRNRRKAS